jgi:diketogulonate reductase-like aldo/keto reductase
MFTTTLANVDMPRLIYGTAWKKERTAELVTMALRSGFRGIDTACQPRHYNEAGVGEALQNVAAEGLTREMLFIQTKFTPIEGQDPNNIPYDKNAPLAMQVEESFQTSQTNLHTHYVDSYVLHSPLFPFANLIKVWRAMEKIALKGGARQLGISNCYDLGTLKRLFEEANIKPAVVQNRFYADTNYDTQLRAFCDSQNIRYQSFWSLTANPHLLGSEAVVRAAIKRRCNPAQIFYAYLMAKEITPLDGTTSKEHMQEDLAVFEIALEPQEIISIDKLISL